MKMKKMNIFAVKTNTSKDKDLTALFETCLFLAGRGAMVRVSSEHESECPAELRGRVIFSGEKEIYTGADAAVVIGGDGTILDTAAASIDSGCAMIGINLGKTGYMAEIERSEIPLLARLMEGEYRIEERITLRVEAEDTGGKRKVIADNVLNDAVISHGEFPRVIDINLYSGRALVTNYRADGLIASTPTGSTAYSMSAGGPIIEPTMSCIAITPICSYSLTARPLVFSCEEEMCIENIFERGECVYLTVDGKLNFRVGYMEKIIITKSPHKARMIKLKDNNFFSVLQTKMSAFK